VIGRIQDSTKEVLLLSTKDIICFMMNDDDDSCHFRVQVLATRKVRFLFLSDVERVG
jgi:hypothetical protein